MFSYKNYSHNQYQKHGLHQMHIYFCGLQESKQYPNAKILIILLSLNCTMKKLIRSIFIDWIIKYVYTMQIKVYI